MKVALSKVTLKQDNYKILTTLPLGTHNVCVCHIHQSMRLKLIGLNGILQKKGMEKKYEVCNILKLMVCENSTTACFLLDCDQCSGVGPIVNELSDLFDSNGIEEITFKSWTKTGR